MRAYEIIITNPDTGALVRPSYYDTLNQQASYTSFVGGPLGNFQNPAAPQIELDLPLYNYAAPKQGGTLRIWGVSIQEMAQPFDLNFKNIIIKAGMQKGLPLANPSQYGTILEGSILQAYGNWEGTLQYLAITLIPPLFSSTSVASKNQTNISFNWPKNTPLQSAIEKTLSDAFPTTGPNKKYDISVKISPDLKQSFDQHGFYYKLSEFAKAIQNMTDPATNTQFKGFKTLSGGDYQGVNITIQGKTILVYDGTVDTGRPSSANPTSIAFQDLIGQPTWIGPAQINFKTVLRADIAVGDYIKLPDKLTAPFVLSTPASSLPGFPARNKSIFQGSFIIVNVHHWANSRDISAGSWATTFDAIADLATVPTIGGVQ